MNPILTPNNMIHCYPSKNLGTEETYESLIGMNMARKNHVNSSPIKQFFHSFSHAFSFPFMSSIGVVPGCVEQYHKPWSPPSINFVQIGLKPLELVRACIKVRVWAQHHNMDSDHIERIIQIWCGPTLPEWHDPPCIIGLEAFGLEYGKRFYLMVTFNRKETISFSSVTGQKSYIYVCLRVWFWWEGRWFDHNS